QSLMVLARRVCRGVSDTRDRYCMLGGRNLLNPIVWQYSTDSTQAWRALMQSATQTVPVSKKRLWAGRILSTLPALFLLVDGAMKLVKPEPVVKATVELGYAETVILPLGVVLLACTILYLIPQTAVLGAILLTGYLGGAVATHVRAGQGLFEI